MKRLTDFTDEERAVICKRRKFESNVDLAKVFNCHPITIAAIARRG